MPKVAPGLQCDFHVCQYVVPTLYVATDDFDASGFPMTGKINETNSDQCFNITIINDNRREDTETFTVHIEVTGSQGNISYDAINTTVSIEDDDSKLT